MAKRKGINIINPADVAVNQEDLQMYVELIGVRRSESVLVGKYYGNIDNSNFQFDDKIVRFNAISNENTYTTNWTDFERGDKELFGISDISIKQEANYIMKVDVTFIDIRGYGLMSVGALVDNGDERTVQYTSPYSILFDLPAAFYKLRVKGYYGKSININLTLPKPPVISFDESTGNYKVTASFVSWTFGILRDIKVEYLLASPFLREKLSGAGFDGGSLTVDPRNSNITSLKGLIEKSKELNRVVENYKNDEKLKKFELVTKKVNLYQSLRVKYQDLFTYITDNRLSYEVTDSEIKILTNSVNPSNNFNSNIIRRVKELESVNNSNKLELPSLSDKIETSITINNGLFSGTTSSGILVVNGGNKYTNNFNVLSNKVQNEYKNLGQEINNSLENEVKKTLGFIPTVGNVVRVLCNDIDIFLSLFKDMLVRSELNHTSTNQSAPKEGDTLNDEKTPFPVFIERTSYPDLDNGDSEVIYGEVEAYPGSNPLYTSWPECQFIEAYLSVKTSTADFSNKDNLNFENVENNKPTFIPSTNSETQYPYKNITNLDLTLTKVIDRYLYIKSFVYGKNNLDDIQKFIASKESYNLSRNFTKDNQIYQALIDYYNRNKGNLLATIRNNTTNLPQTNSLINNTSIKTSNGQHAKDDSVFNGTNKFETVTVEKNNKPVKIFTTTGDEVYDKTLNNLTNNTNWISNLMNGKGGSYNKNGKPSVVVDSFGNLLVPDYNYRSDNKLTDYRLPKIDTSIDINDLLESQVLTNYDKFLAISKALFTSIPTDFTKLPAIYELPLMVLYQINSDFASELSFNDREYLTDLLNDYANDNIEELRELFSTSNQILLNDTYEFFNDRVLFKVSSHYSLTGTYQDYNLNESTDIEPYLNNFMELLQTYVSNKPEPLPVKSGNIDSKIDSNESKLELYKNFQGLYKRWFSADGLDIFDNQSLFDYFRFVDRAGRDITNKIIVNFDGMISKIKNNPTTNFYELITGLLADNGFLFLPYENFISFDGDEDEEFNRNLLFGTDLAVEAKSFPSMTCIFAGGNSTTLNIPSNKKKNDSFNICDGGDNVPADFKDGNVNIFTVNIGEENQNIFTGIKVSTENFTRNMNYYEMEATIAKNGETPSKAARIGQSILSPYQLASFTVTVTAMGNAAIQAGMYFCLKGVNLFDGTYLITNVTHSINEKGMVTDFSGYRVPRYPLPLVQTYFASFVKTFVFPNIEIPAFVVDNNPNKGLTQSNTINSLPLTGNTSVDVIETIGNVEITSGSTDVRSIARGEITFLNITQQSPSSPKYEFVGDGEFVLVYHGQIESGEFNGRYLYSQYSYLSRLEQRNLRNVNVNDVIGKTGNTGENSLRSQNKLGVGLKLFVSDSDSIEVTSDNKIKNSVTLLTREQFNNNYKLTDRYRLGV
jgi:hypothetical protein